MEQIDPEVLAGLTGDLAAVTAERDRLRWEVDDLSTRIPQHNAAWEAYLLRRDNEWAGIFERSGRGTPAPPPRSARWETIVNAIATGQEAPTGLTAARVAEIVALLQEVKARVAAVTEGPWEWHRDDLFGPERTILTLWDLADEQPTPEEQDFIAAARTDVPALTAIVEELLAELRRRGDWL